MKKSEKRGKMIRVRVNDNELHELRSIANKLGVTLSELVRRAPYGLILNAGKGGQHGL